MCVLVIHSHTVIYHMGEHAAVGRGGGGDGVRESLFRWREVLLTSLLQTHAQEIAINLCERKIDESSEFPIVSYFSVVQYNLGRQQLIVK